MPKTSFTTAGLALFLTTLPSTRAAPLSHLYKRELGTGAKAGLGIGIALVAMTLVAIIIFFIVHFRRKAHLSKINEERAILAGEKNADGSDKPDKFAPEPSAGLPRRQKSVKDRLMGPLYRGSTIDMIPLPPKIHNPNRDSTLSTQSGDASFISKPWAKDGENSPRASFSSKRATRMMMMM
ncbi:hypothetical protein H2200_006807 [Cladophialophora chaetospira]|uniref:Uncharacterized protein n=1 Tax=Cladophialophora chaetospira TaxID=386627 RepID=A0AA38X8W7_9EURO|nr:hypothetical protein H2200_006807 [Cladophialophora chaetospira]